MDRGLEDGIRRVLVEGIHDDRNLTPEALKVDPCKRGAIADHEAPSASVGAVKCRVGGENFPLCW
jgi:hypothetical protein